MSMVGYSAKVTFSLFARLVSSNLYLSSLSTLATAHTLLVFIEEEVVLIAGDL
jgi:hypothetical protein